MNPPTLTDITKQNIEEAFWQLYKPGGMSKISVTQICKIAGYNRSTFYAYYEDIYAVLNAIEEKIIPTESFKEELLLPLMHCQDEKALLEKVLSFFELHSPYLPVLLGEYGDPLFRHKLLTRFSPILHSYFADNAQKTQKLNYILEYQNAAVISTIAKWYQNGKDIPTNELIELLLELTRTGVSAALKKRENCNF